MRTVLHLSDVHFGRVDYQTVKPLIAAAHAIAPDVVVLSGDLTQRATSEEYIEARDFLSELPLPQIVVPGNHDIPLYNPIKRFLHPLDNFEKFITSDLAPFYADEEIAVIGVNSARSLTSKYGRINMKQVETIRNRFAFAAPDVFRCVVTHHPFDLPEGYVHTKQLIGRSELAMRELAKSGVDLFLSGHLHQGYFGSTAARYKIDKYAALIVEAGTATSTRGRGEPNSFNVIIFDRPLVTVKRYSWNSNALSFDISLEEVFERGENGWMKKVIA